MEPNERYGTQLGATELAHLIADALGVAFIERESDYRGVYLQAVGPVFEVTIQPNAIPGDDGDDLYEPDHPDVRTLLLLQGATRATDIDASLAAIAGLTRLDLTESDPDGS